MNPRLRRIRDEYERTRDVAQFASALEAMIAAGEDFFRVYASLGQACQLQGRLEEAIAAFEEAIARYPDHHEVVYQLARTRARLGRHDEAIEDFDRACALDPADSKPEADKGSSLLVLGRVDEAAAAFRRALAIDASDTVAARGLEMAEQLSAMAPEDRPPVVHDTSAPLVQLRPRRK